MQVLALWQAMAAGNLSGESGILLACLKLRNSLPCQHPKGSKSAVYCQSSKQTRKNELVVYRPHHTRKTMNLVEERGEIYLAEPMVITLVLSKRYNKYYT